MEYSKVSEEMPLADLKCDPVCHFLCSGTTPSISVSLPPCARGYSGMSTERKAIPVTIIQVYDLLACKDGPSADY